MNQELPDVQAGFRKCRGTRDQIANIFLDHIESKGIPEKHLLLLLDYAKAFDCVDHNKLWKILQKKGLTDLPLEKSVCRSRSNSYKWTWNNRLVPNKERTTSRLYIVTLLI